MSSESISINLGGKDWIDSIESILNEKSYYPPEICLWFAVADMIQVHKGQWVLQQIRKYLENGTFNQDAMMSECYRWWFEKECIIVCDYWNLFYCSKTNFSSLENLIELQTNIVYEKQKPYELSIDFFDFKFLDRPDISEYDINSGDRIL